jgi:hypothetical protein
MCKAGRGQGAKGADEIEQAAKRQPTGLDFQLR